MIKKNIIEVKDLTKKYPLFDTPFQKFSYALLNRPVRNHKEVLKDINICIKNGEVVGIIGENGTGKSTLLKIITGVLDKTSGKVRVRGSVASLLELGIGFNPDLTGVENIRYTLNLYNVPESDVPVHIDFIKEFSEIGDYLNQPIKTYSSGMIARLGFAVAVNVDPDILIVDEALSVGDLKFQQKCIRKMKEFKDKNKTIIFVSHDLGAVRSFCDRVIWLHEGRVRLDGKVKEVTTKFSHFMYFGESKVVAEADSLLGNEVDGNSVEINKDLADEKELNHDAGKYISTGSSEIIIESFRVFDSLSKMDSSFFTPGKYYTVRLNLKVIDLDKVSIEDLIFGFSVANKNGTSVFSINTFVYDYKFDNLDFSCIEIKFLFPNIAPGTYIGSLAIAEGTQASHRSITWLHDCFKLMVQDDFNYSQIGLTYVSPSDVSFHIQ